jgi:hypothetical protein
MVHLPKDAAPETVRPPADVRFGQIPAVAPCFWIRRINDFIAAAGTLGIQFRADFLIGSVCPFFIFAAEIICHTAILPFSDRRKAAWRSGFIFPETIEFSFPCFSNFIL